MEKLLQDIYTTDLKKGIADYVLFGESIMRRTGIILYDLFENKDCPKMKDIYINIIQTFFKNEFEIAYA